MYISKENFIKENTELVNDYKNYLVLINRIREVLPKFDGKKFSVRFTKAINEGIDIYKMCVSHEDNGYSKRLTFRSGRRSDTLYENYLNSANQYYIGVSDGVINGDYLIAALNRYEESIKKSIATYEDAVNNYDKYVGMLYDFSKKYNELLAEIPFPLHPSDIKFIRNCFGK